MRKQNPPSANIKKALEFEKYLRPAILACIYGMTALLWVAIVALIFSILVLGSVLHPTFQAIVIAALVADVPVLFVLMAHSRRPNDPLSLYLSRHANEWRRPLEVPGDECIFKTALRQGDEMLIVKVAFHYPAKYQAPEVKERLYTFTHAAFTSEFAMRFTLPSFAEVERAMGPSMEMLGTEYDIPVLYPEILDVRKTRVVYDISELKLQSQDIAQLDDDYMATGTAG